MPDQPWDMTPDQAAQQQQDIAKLMTSPWEGETDEQKAWIAANPQKSSPYMPYGMYVPKSWYAVNHPDPNYKPGPAIPGSHAQSNPTQTPTPTATQNPGFTGSGSVPQFIESLGGGMFRDYFGTYQGDSGGVRPRNDTTIPLPTQQQSTATQGSTGQQSPLSPSPFPTQQQSTGTPSVSSTNPYMSLPSYGTSTGMYQQSFANSGTQNQADASGGTGNYSPTNYNKLPTYGFYY